MSSTTQSVINATVASLETASNLEKQKIESATKDDAVSVSKDIVVNRASTPTPTVEAESPREATVTPETTSRCPFAWVPAGAAKASTKASTYKKKGTNPTRLVRSASGLLSPRQMKLVNVILAMCALISAYFYAHCTSSDQDPVPAKFSLQEVLCGINSNVFGMSDWERKFNLFLGFMGIAVNVVPKYLKQDLAVRHKHNILQHVSIMTLNPLFLHIFGGIGTVMWSGFVAVTKSFTWPYLTVLVLFDFIHQFTIYRLIKNHDGIWQLRPGQVCLAICKWIACMRIIAGHDPEPQVDVVLFMSCGFVFARIGSFATGFTIYTFCDTSMWSQEHWYSLGVGGAQLYVFSRTMGTSLPVFWFSSCICSVLFYHPKWDSELQNQFFSFNTFGLAMTFILPRPLQYALTAAYFLLGFWTPIFHRHRFGESRQSVWTPKPRKPGTPSLFRSFSRSLLDIVSTKKPLPSSTPRSRRS